MQENSALRRAVAIVRDLRRRCPCDRVQTRETIRPYLVEEVFELDHALAEGDRHAVREEVADLLLHLAWQLVLAEELGDFSAAAVADDLEAKMRRRHPHLFDLGPGAGWERLKHREGRTGVLEGLPQALPALLLACRLQERAASVGFDWPDPQGPAAKVREELREVEVALATPSGTDPAASESVVEEIGDLLFAVVNLARKTRVSPTIALERANRKFRDRFRRVEALAAERGLDLHSAGLAALDRLWDEVKQDR